MNVAAQTTGSGAAPVEGDPLDSLAEVLFCKMGSDGVYARTALYEGVIEGLAAVITRYREPNTEMMRFPPVMSRRQLETLGYLKSFPNLLGCVCGLHGTEHEIHSAVNRFDNGGDWTTSLSASDLVLSPAAQYPPRSGLLPREGACPQADYTLMLLPIVSVVSPLAISIDFSHSGCGSTSASAARTMHWIFAGAGLSERRPSRAPSV